MYCEKHLSFEYILLQVWLIFNSQKKKKKKKKLLQAAGVSG